MKSIVLFAAVLRMILITAIISFTIIANAQNVAVNTTGNSADASAMLDVSSTTKGFLAPRMTTVQRTGIPSPANGLLVFDTNTKTYWYFSNTWKEITNGGGGGNFVLPYSGIADNATPAFSITNTNTSFGSSALFGRGGSTSSGVTPLGNVGVWGDNSTGIGIAGTSKSIGVFGATGLNDVSGIGVLGLTSSTSTNNGSVTALNQSTGNALFAESTGGGTAVYGKTTKQNGAAIYGINNSVQGHGVRGAATGTDGVGIYGDGGVGNSSSYAGFFRNSNATNTKDVVQIYNQGAGRGLMVDVVNSSNNDDAIEVRNSGTGNFLKLVTGTNEVKATIAKNGQINTDGNIYTEGNLYVQGLKGIVRNTYSNQMRMEVMNVTVPGGFHFVVNGGGFGEVFIAVQDITVTFNTPFTQAPAVYRANLASGDQRLEYLGWKIYDVTTTGFKITISPISTMDFTSTNAVFKFVVVGND